MSAASGPVRQMPSDPFFAQSDTVTHEWTDGRGRRMHVALRVSYGTKAARAPVAAAQVQENWDSAVQQARRVCEGADLTTGPGTVSCEEQLCSVLTSVLFPRVHDEEGAFVDRVIWKRLTWD